MINSPDQNPKDNDPSNGYRPSENPRSTQDQEEGCFTCNTCGKGWPSHRSRVSHQVHCRKTQERNQRSNASRPNLRQTCQTGNGPVHNHSTNPTGKCFLHQKKDHVNVKETCENLESMPRLNLPNAGDLGAWSELDNELSDALSTLPDYKDPAIQIERREKFIYNYLKEKFGVKKSGTSSRPRKVTKSRQQKRLRRLKKDLKKKFKQAVRDSKPEQELGKMRQDFLKMIRLHNKVRKLELKQKEKQENNKSNERFKENPHKYAKDLLNDQKKQGEPEFGKEAADKFFKSTYKDSNRHHSYNPLEGIPKPDPPKQKFTSKPPSNRSGASRNSATQEKQICTWHQRSPVSGV